MALPEAILESLSQRVALDDPLTNADRKRLRDAYYQLRHESEREIADCAEEESAVHDTLLALHGYERDQIEEAAFLRAVAEAGEPTAGGNSKDVRPAMRAGIAFRLAFSAYFYRRWSHASDPGAARRLAASFLFQLTELNRYLVDYEREPSNPRICPSTPASLAQMRLEI